jgi:hypothetical protein
MRDDQGYDANTTWLFLARCRGEDPAIFFPSSESSAQDIARARVYCRECSVSADCLEYNLTAFNSTSDEGVWAGFTVNQRNAIRKEREKRVKRGSKWGEDG